MILCLENIPDDWRNMLLSKWGVLEEIYAFNLDNGINELTLDDIHIIDKTLLNIKEKIKQSKAM